MANGKEPKEHDLPKPSTPLQYPFGEGRSTPSKKDIRKSGVAFWESLRGKHTTEGETAEFNKELTATASGRSYYHECPEKSWKIPPKFLKHDFNKAFVYPVNIFHCAHHDKLDFMDYPRITMVQFL